MNYPQKIKIDDTIYTINTDFRVAIKCEEIAEDSSINDYERPLAIICTLFGEKALDNPNHYQKLFDYAIDYLRCGKPMQETNEEPDMNYSQDMPLIEASFMSDFHIDLENTKMHWWKFNILINGLSNSELGNCCVLNKYRWGRKYDPNKIDNPKERSEFIEWQKSIALNKKGHKKEYTEEEKNNMKEFYEQMGL